MGTPQAALRGARSGALAGAAIGWATHIAYSALLGAAYGVIRNRSRLSRPAQQLVGSALAYAAWLPNRAPAPRRGARIKKLAAQRSPTLFSGALMSGFEAVSKR